mmetsp:Transcript_1132/g.2887  ORF Transcript_1132/g.2887 Transcript_1132/m.2887 type:complete len:138 (-) Transcript_1132:2106-2519(-)
MHPSIALYYIVLDCIALRTVALGVKYQTHGQQWLGVYVRNGSNALRYRRTLHFTVPNQRRTHNKRNPKPGPQIPTVRLAVTDGSSSIILPQFIAWFGIRMHPVSSHLSLCPIRSVTIQWTESDWIAFCIRWTPLASR